MTCDRCGHADSEHQLMGNPTPCRHVEAVGCRGLHRSPPKIAHRPCDCKCFRAAA